MSLIRRCDGCGKDIEPDHKGPLDNYFTLRIPKQGSLRAELEFHDYGCLARWVEMTYRTEGSR
jgi:hypothetical protein